MEDTRPPSWTVEAFATDWSPSPVHVTSYVTFPEAQAAAEDAVAELVSTFGHVGAVATIVCRACRWRLAYVDAHGFGYDCEDHADGLSTPPCVDHGELVG